MTGYDPRPNLLHEAIYFTQRPAHTYLVRNAERLAEYRRLYDEAVRSGEIENCPGCEGTGIVHIDKYDVYQGKVQVPVDCGRCNGLGKRVSAFHVKINRPKKAA